MPGREPLALPAAGPRGAIERDVHELTAHGGRAVGSVGHRNARAYIVARMTEIGLTPYRSRFIHEYEDGFANVIGVFPGSVEDGLAAVVIGAHYDTCGNLPGADDNATGVALLFSLAEALQRTERRRTIVFAAFDAEEPPSS